MILTRLNALQYTKVKIALTSFCGTVCTILLSSAIFAGASGALNAQMPIASWTTGICRNTMLFTSLRRFRASGLQPRRGSYRPSRLLLPELPSSPERSISSSKDHGCTC